MATSRKRKRLSDAYRFDGFRPLEELRGVFGDPVARVITLVRRQKKRAARDVLEHVRVTTTSECLREICPVEVAESIWTSKCAGSDVNAITP